MLETFKVRLKAKYSGVNLSQKRIDAIADRLNKKFPDLTDEADHDQKLDELNELTPFAEIARDDDKIRTLEAKSKGQSQSQQQQQQSSNNNDGGSNADKTNPADEMPAWFKSYAEKVDRMEADKQQSSIKQIIAQKLKDVPEKIWSRMALPNKEEDVETWCNDVAQDWANLNVNTPKPGSGSPSGGTTESVKADILAFATKGKDGK